MYRFATLITLFAHHKIVVVLRTDSEAEGASRTLFSLFYLHQTYTTICNISFIECWNVCKDGVSCPRIMPDPSNGGSR